MRSKKRNQKRIFPANFFKKNRGRPTSINCLTKLFLMILMTNFALATEKKGCPPPGLNNKKTPEVVIQQQFKLFYNLPETRINEKYELLRAILEENPMNLVAQKEMGYLQIKFGNDKLAKECFNYALKAEPENQMLIKQISYINNKKNFKSSSNYKNKIKNIKNKISSQPHKQQYLNKAYEAINEKKYQEAYINLNKAKALDPLDNQINMQYAYVLDSLNKKREAYWQFSKVTKANDKKFSFNANTAMSNLSGLQTKLLSNSWFLDFYYAPFYFSRFDLFVYPFQLRLGKRFFKDQSLELYFSNRTTMDSKSGKETSVQLPQIYEDNVSIFSLGIRYALFKNTYGQLQAFSELGKAYNIKNINKENQWENDFRGGLIYYHDWGAKPQYVDESQFTLKPIGKIFSDITYFTRYQGNIIGFLTLKEGLRIFQHHTTDIDMYLRLRGGLDKNKDFYNNFIEIGPGVELIPNHRYNLSVRYEYLKGFYIKRQALDLNPYAPQYDNNLILLEIYMEI